MSLALLFHYLLLNMFRILVHPSSGVCDLLWIYFMCCIALVRCVLVLRCGLAGVVWCGIRIPHHPIISLFNAQHVSDVNTSILRSLRLICWVISRVVLLWYDVCRSYGVVWLGWCCIRMQNEALLQPASGYQVRMSAWGQSLAFTKDVSRGLTFGEDYHIDIQDLLDCSNPANAKLNPSCHLLTLLVTHHILHVNRIRVPWRYNAWRFIGNFSGLKTWRWGNKFLRHPRNYLSVDGVSCSNQSKSAL